MPNIERRFGYNIHHNELGISLHVFLETATQKNSKKGVRPVERVWGNPLVQDTCIATRNNDQHGRHVIRVNWEYTPRCEDHGVFAPGDGLRIACYLHFERY